MTHLIHFSEKHEKTPTVYAVIVTFNGIWPNVFKLIEQLVIDGIGYIVVDNGSNNFDNSNLINMLPLGENLGIAHAQNIGIEYCRTQGAQIVVFFDQDSMIETGFINALIYPILVGRTKIAAPVFFDAKKGFSYPIVSISKSGLRTRHYSHEIQADLRTNVVISSGTAVDIEVFSVVGLMNSSLFIDYVDTEWCMRCADAGYTALVNPSARMNHSIGDKSYKFLIFRIPVHSPLRRYYRIRNAFLLSRMPHIPKLMAMREIIFSFLHQIILIAASKGERWEYFKYMCIGIGHGLINRRGRL